MIDQSSLYKNRWWQRILDSRRRYFFDHVRSLNRITDFSFLQTLKWIAADVAYVSTWTVNILLQIRAYGPAIKENYDVSLIKQFYHMMYLTFFIKINPDNYRRLQLYKPENRKHIKEFAYFHTQLQRDLTAISFPGEMDLFLNKFRFYEFCRSHKISSPNILGVFQNGEMIYPKEQDLKLPEEDLFIKNMGGQMGWGAKKLHFRNSAYFDNEGKEYSIDNVFKFLADYSLKNSAVILQNVVLNHPSWQPFTSGGLATCRIVTAKLPDNEKIVPLFSAFRMPTGKSDVDNFSAGGLIAPVHQKTGVLGKAIGSIPVNCAFEFDRHPNTHHKIEGTELPNWTDLLEFTLDLHSRVKSPFIGWDVLMSDQGCCVLEGSLLWASGSYECSHQKPLKQTIYPVLFEQWVEKISAAHD